MSLEEKKAARDLEAGNEAESVYSVDELADAAETLGATPDIVKTALRMESLTESTVSEARRIVTKFKKREVR